MKAYKIIFDNGDYEITGFNGDIETARRYYVGHVFNVGTYEDLLVTCVSVEEV